MQLSRSLPQFLLLCGISVLVAGASLGAPETMERVVQRSPGGGSYFSVIPVGNHKDGSVDPGVTITGNTITMPSGGRNVFLEIRLGDWDPLDTGADLQAYEWFIDTDGFSNEFPGGLSPHVISCTSTSECEAALGIGSRCVDGAECPPGIDCCKSGFVDQSRPDFVYLNMNPVLCNAYALPAETRGACSLIGFSAPDPIPFPSEGLYVGTIVVEVSADAKGTLSAPLGDVPQSVIVDQDGEFIVPLSLFGATIEIPVGRCCYDLQAQPQCVDQVSEGECDSLPGPSLFSSGVLCADVPGACSADCNNDGRLDIETLADGTSGDCNANDIPDDCESYCAQLDDPLPQTPAIIKNRYLSVDVGNSTCRVALRVTPVSLPAGAEALLGQSLWAGRPKEVCENTNSSAHPPCDQGLGGSLWTAPLDCAPRYEMYGALGTIHLFHEIVVPGGSYVVEAIHEGCDSSSMQGATAPLDLSTSLWGDVAGPFDIATGGWMSPDQSVNITIDVVALLDKFSNRPLAPSKLRIDIQPSTPDQQVNVLEISYMLNAFNGAGYPFFPISSPCDD